MRVWVTGIGVISPLGDSAPATMDRLLAGERAFAPVTLFDATGCRSGIAAEIAGLSVADIAPAGRADAWSRTDAMAVLAAREALQQAGIDARAEPAVDLIIGGTTAGMFETEDLLAEMATDPRSLAPINRMLSHPLSATADRLGEVVLPFRQARTVCSACSSGANAMLLGASRIRSGQAACVLAGAADGLCRLTYVGFSALGAMSAAPCRPFDVRRDGLNLGEGAAFLVLEAAEAARRRGAAPIVELRGWAVGAEAHHITNPERSGATAARLMRQALESGRLAPDDIDYVNAHGTATRLNDAMESAALASCFGPEIERIPVSSSKGQIGHTLGASGAIEAAITALAVERAALPPTAGLSQVDPECRLVHLTEARRVDRIRAALSSSFGFGGTDTVLAFTQPEDFDELPATQPRRVVVTGAGSVGPLGVRGSDGQQDYLPAPEQGGRPRAEPVAFDAATHLDIARARRIDRAGRLATTAALTALRAAGREILPASRAARAGAIIGAAFGAVDGCADYVRRIQVKGAKYAPPATFPNLVPSSPVAHTSIYLGLGGPVFSLADLRVTSEGAMITAVELIAAGEAELIAAGGVEELSTITEQVLRLVCLGAGVAAGGDDGAQPPGEAAVVLLFEAEPAQPAAARSAVAEVAWHHGWRGGPAGRLATAPEPDGRGAVLLGREDAASRAALQGSAWAQAARYPTQSRVGNQECAGGFAAAAAVSLLQQRALDMVLVLGAAPDRGYAMVLQAIGSP